MTAPSLRSLNCVALLALATAVVLAPVSARAQDACDPSQGVIYAPGQDTSGLVLFEDLWPTNGDLDFNDQAVAYHYEFLLDTAGKVVTMQATFNLLAAGASIHNGLYLHLPLLRGANPVAVLDAGGNTITPLLTETDLVIPVVDDTRSLFSDQYAYINTEPYTPVESSTPLVFTITFSNGAALDTSASPFDLFIARSGDFTHQIHLPQYRGTDAMNTGLFGLANDGSNQDLSTVGGADNTGRWFVNVDGLPFALAVPQVIEWPQEKVAIESVYTDLTTFASSGGTEDSGWYSDTPNINSTLAFTHGTSGTGHQVPPPQPTLPAPTLSCSVYTGDTACVNWGLVVLDAVNDNDTCFRQDSPVIDTNWFPHDMEFCDTTYVCSTAYAAYMFWHFSDDSPLPEWPDNVSGAACNSAYPSQGCCATAPSIDQACQVDSQGACITTTSPNGDQECLGPQ